jgi:hypothetical protein
MLSLRGEVIHLGEDTFLSRLYVFHATYCFLVLSVTMLNQYINYFYDFPFSYSDISE